MVILEFKLLNNEVPYQRQPSSLVSIKPGFKRILWGLLLSCWQRDPEDRPSANIPRDIVSLTLYIFKPLSNIYHQTQRAISFGEYLNDAGTMSPRAGQTHLMCETSCASC
ncbi:hypothetical protein RSAG8_05985, partial [Rhizoctonia solani AG-8 WAC10335]